MKKKLSPFNNAEDDLFFWIKEYLGSRVHRLNIDKEFEGMFDCNKAYNEIISSNNIDELNKVTLGIRNNGVKALRSYTFPLFWLYDFLKEEELKNLSDFDLDYRDKLLRKNSKNYSYTTLESYATQIHSLFTYIEQNATLGDNVNVSFMLGSGYCGIEDYAEERQIAYFTSDKIMQLIVKMSTFRYKGTSLVKATIMLKLILFAGLSSEELANMKRNDIRIVKDPDPNLQGTYVKLEIKHTKHRTTYIKRTLLGEEYKAYMNEYRLLYGLKGSQPLFYTLDEKPYDSNSISQMITRLIRHAGFNKKEFTPARLKYSYAIYLVKNGIIPEIVSLLFGGKTEFMNLYNDKKIKEEIENFEIFGWA